MSTWALLYNPHAGGISNELVNNVKQSLEGLGITLNTYASHYAGHLKVLASTISGVERIVVMGGDGSINEAMNGLVARDMPMAIFPAGTANVLARELRISKSITKWVTQIFEQHAQPIYPGVVNGRYFLLMAGFGFDAKVVQKVDLGLKRHLKAGAYVWQGIKHWMQETNPTFHVQLEPHLAETISDAKGASSTVMTKSKPIAEISSSRVMLDTIAQNKITSVANWAVFCRARHYGGAPVLHPQAGLTKPWLGAVTVAEGDLKRFIWRALMINSYISRHLSRKTTNKDGGMRHEIFQGTVLNDEQPIGCQVDGEWLGEAQRWEVSISKLPIQLYVHPNWQG